MFRYKNKITALIVIAVILVPAAFIVFAEESAEIDLEQLKQNNANPFAQFAGAGQQPAQVRPTPQTPKPELIVETATLKFVDAKSLKTSIFNMSSEWGSIEPDGKSNALIICDTNENLQKILTQIHKIDRKPDQIMIEVIILDVKLDNQSEIGINWDLLTTEDRDTVYRQNFTDRLGSTVKDSTTVGKATAWNTTGTGADFWLLTGDIRNVLHVLQTKNNVEILASPRVMVLSGQDASIQAVEQIPYQEKTSTSDGGSMTGVQFKDVGVTLNVSATLTDDKFILLNIQADQKVQTGTAITVDGGASVPVVDARLVKSSLMLEDGQILAIGGLRRKETQKQTTQVPILGDLPIVGMAFKNTDTVQNNSELLVIISPHIYSGEKLATPEMAKYKEISTRPLLQIPEDERQKDNTKKDKKNSKSGKDKKKSKNVKSVKAD